MLPRNELIDIVAADLRYLLEEWDEKVDDHSLRRSSPVLRRLLVQNELQRAWKAAGFAGEPKLRASTLAPILADIPYQKILFAAAGGAKYKGLELRSVLVVNNAINQDEISKRHAEGPPSTIISLHDFVETPCLVIKGRLIKRRVLIKYIANKLGGAHYDTKRKKNYDENLFPYLDAAAKQFRLGDKNHVYFELLSAGQALVSSDDIKLFCQRVQSGRLG